MAPRKTPSTQPQPIARRNETSAGGVIWRRSGEAIEIVMVRPTGKDAWTLPKGTPVPGETAIETAARETREETGLEVIPGERVGDISYVFTWRDQPGGPATRIFKRVHYFLMRPSGGDFSAHDHEVEEVRWVKLEEAEELASYKGDREIVAKVRHLLTTQ